MNKPGRSASGARSRVWGTAIAAALVLCLNSPVVAKDHPGKGGPVQAPAAAPQVDKQALKELRKQQHAAAKADRIAAKQQRQAARAQRKAAKAQQRTARQAAKAQQKTQRKAAKQQQQAAKHAAGPAALSRAAASQSTAASRAPVAVTATRAARRAAIAQRRAAVRRRAAARRATIRRRALARRRAAIRRRAAAAAPVLTALPVATTSTPTATPPPAKKAPAKKAPAKKDDGNSDSGRGPVTVVTHTVRDIAQVIPGWAKALMLALGALLAVAALLILAGWLRNRRLRALSAQLREEIGTLSAALMPMIPNRVGMLAVSVAYRPAAGVAAGGDFYDVFPLDRGRVGVVVGDVSGHGRDSLGPAVFIRHMVRSYLEGGLAPRAALHLAGKVVDEHNTDDFATVIAAVHDPSAGTLSYATAGHPPPIVTGIAAHRPLTVASSPPLGADQPTGLRQTTMPVSPGTSLTFVTDGLIEARRGDSIMGVPRVERVVREVGPNGTADDVIDRVARETDSMPDDIVVCMIGVEGGARTNSTLRVEELEVTGAELEGSRVRRFLAACELPDEEIDEAIKQARPLAVKHGAVVLRVRLADDRSGVDVLPVESSGPGAELTALSRTSA